MIDAFRKVDKIVDRMQEFFCFTLFFAMIIVGGISIFSRFVFNLSITWAEEVIRFLCIWLTFVGAALTVRKDGHVSVDIVITMIKNNKVRAIYYAVSRIISIVFLVILFPAACQLVAKTGNSMAASVKISFAWIYLAVPVGIINMLWAYISALPYYTKKTYETDQVTLMEEIAEENKEAKQHRFEVSVDITSEAEEDEK